MLQLILDYYELGLENIKRGANIHQLKKLKVVSQINRIKFTVSNDEIDKIDEIWDDLRHSMKQIEDMFD